MHQVDGLMINVSVIHMEMLSLDSSIQMAQLLVVLYGGNRIYQLKDQVYIIVVMENLCIIKLLQK